MLQSSFADTFLGNRTRLTIVFLVALLAFGFWDQKREIREVYEKATSDYGQRLFWEGVYFVRNTEYQGTGWSHDPRKWTKKQTTPGFISAFLKIARKNYLITTIGLLLVWGGALTTKWVLQGLKGEQTQ